MKNYFVYKHTNQTNGKVYIGLTKQNPKSRWGKNGINYKNKCPHFWNAIQKYGWGGFLHEIVASELTREEACDLEVLLISKYNAQNPEFGYNILEGGSAPTIPEEVRKKMSKSMQGNKNGLGKPCSEEKKLKIQASLVGKKFTEEHKHNISKAKKGKEGTPCSKETKQKISQSHAKKKVYCEETQVVYESIQSCAKELGLDATNVCAVCKGKHKHVKGYHLSYTV